MKANILKIKLALIIFVVIVTVITFGWNNLFTQNVGATISGPPAGRTGAPGEQTCTDCHQINFGTGQFRIVAPTNYTPGQTYQIQIIHSTTDNSRLIWGFQAIPLAGTAMAGSVANITAVTRTRVSGTKTYIEQSSSGVFTSQTGGATWSFNWTAPSTNVGNVTFYASGLQGDDDGSETGDVTYTASAVVQPQATVVIHHGFCDFDGDGKGDISVFRPSNGIWFLNRSTAGFAGVQLGSATDKLIPADFDGDDKTDFAVWHEAPANEAAFYILQSSNSTLRIERFGQTGDNPLVAGDWDGDGKADVAVYRDSAVGSQSYFYYRGSLNNPNGNITFLPWGTTGDKPMRGDFDGDGKADLAVFRNGNWYINQSSNNQLKVDYWGLNTDKFVNADYDGDNKTDLAVYRNGVWYIKQSSNSQAKYFYWGLSTDTPAPADFDGDGKTDVAIYRGGNWYIMQSSNSTMKAQPFGLTTDLPLSGAFVQ